MKLIASVILSVHLLTVSAQGFSSFQDLQPFIVSKVDRFNSKVGMSISNTGQPIPIPVGPAPTNGDSNGGGTSGGTDTKDSGSTSSGSADDGMVHALDMVGGGGSSDPPKNGIMDL